MITSAVVASAAGGHGDHSHPALGDRSGLVQHDGVDVPRGLQHLRAR